MNWTAELQEKIKRKNQILFSKDSAFLQDLALLIQGWIAKVTSGLHDLLPDFKKPCKIKFRKRIITLSNPEVNFTNIAETGIYSCNGK